MTDNVIPFSSPNPDEIDVYQNVLQEILEESKEKCLEGID